MMNAIECAVSNAKRKNKDLKDLQHMRIDGSTPAQQRQRNVERFQEEANCRVRVRALYIWWHKSLQLL